MQHTEHKLGHWNKVLLKRWLHLR